MSSDAVPKLTTQTELPGALPAGEPARTSGGHLVNAVAWTAASKWASQIFAWASTLIVVRILSPNDFGLLGLATTYLGLIELVSEFGIGTAIVTLRDLTISQIAQLNTAAVLMGIAGTAISCVLSIPLASFFRAPELHGLLPLMALTFSITAFKSVPYALLQKDLRFATISRLTAAQALLQALGNAILVALGLRYWAIAISSVLSSAIGTYLFLRSRPVTLERPAFKPIYSSIVFSWRILVSRISWYLYSNADFVVAGRTLGKLALGAYTVAWNFANLPGEKIVSLVTSVTPSFFASIQHDKAALRQRLLSITEVLSVVMFPIVSGFAIVAPIAVPIAFGKKWDAAILPMQLLAIYTFLRSICTLLPQVINVVGKTRFGMWNSLATLAVLPVSFLIASRWGIAGIASVWVLVYPFATIPLYWCTLRSIDLPVREYIGALMPSLVSTGLMAIGVYAARLLLPLSMSSVARLGCEIATGTLLYPAMLSLLFPNQFNRYRSLISTLRRH